MPAQAEVNQTSNEAVTQQASAPVQAAIQAVPQAALPQAPIYQTPQAAPHHAAAHRQMPIYQPPQVVPPQSTAGHTQAPVYQPPPEVAQPMPQQAELPIPIEPHTYNNELIYHNPIAPSYIDNDEVIEPVVDTLYTDMSEAEGYNGQPEIYTPPESIGMQGYGGPQNMQGMGNNRNVRSNQGAAAGGSHNTLGGLLSSLLGTGNKNNSNSGSISADSIMDTVAGLKNNFGETITNTLSSVTSPVTQIMDAFGIDSDKLIIIALILILLNEKSDKTLLLALGYLLIF